MDDRTTSDSMILKTRNGDFDEKLKNEGRNYRLLPQLLVACAANSCAFALGSSIGWAAPASPQLSNSTLGFSKSEVSLIGSILNLGGMLGAVSGGWLVGRFGRRKTLLIISPVFFVGFILIGSGFNLAMLLAGRLLTGVAAGLSSIAGPVYAAEIATPNYRGLLGSVFSLFLVCGIEFIYVFGAFFDWSVIAFISASIPAVGFILTMIFVPETPTYLLSIDDEYEAKKSLVRLRGKDCSAELEQLLSEKKQEALKPKSVAFKDLFAKPVLRPTFICVTLMFFQQMCGINAAMFNLTSIFDAAGAGGSMDSSLQVIIIGLVQLVTTAVGSLFVDKAGRKILLSASGLVMGIAMIGLGTFFYLSVPVISESPSNETVSKAGSDILESLSWLPLVSLALFSIFFSVGFGPVVWTVMGELLPAHVKGITSAVVSGVSWGLAFITTVTYGPLVDLMKQYGAFYFYGAFSLLSVVYVIFFVPETSGKTLAEIQQFFE